MAGFSWLTSLSLSKYKRNEWEFQSSSFVDTGFQTTPFPHWSLGIHFPHLNPLSIRYKFKKIQKITFRCLNPYVEPALPYVESSADSICLKMLGNQATTHIQLSAEIYTVLTLLNYFETVWDWSITPKIYPRTFSQSLREECNFTVMFSLWNYINCQIIFYWL